MANRSRLYVARSAPRGESEAECTETRPNMTRDPPTLVETITIIQSRMKSERDKYVDIEMLENEAPRSRQVYF